MCATCRMQEVTLSLDELFRKTEAKPCIYWLPLTEEQVAEKKRKAAAAVEAAAAAQQGGAVAANGPAVVVSAASDKPAVERR